MRRRPPPPPPVFEPETWVIRNDWQATVFSTDIKFKSAASDITEYSKIGIETGSIGFDYDYGDYQQFAYLNYGSKTVGTQYRSALKQEQITSQKWVYGGWDSDVTKYATITFTEESPSGQLLTWLQANATKQ